MNSLREDDKKWLPDRKAHARIRTLFLISGAPGLFKAAMLISRKNSPHHGHYSLRFPSRISLLLVLFFAVVAGAEDPSLPELTRAVRPWEFLPVVGQRAAVFGNEAGVMEGWVYPLKIFRDLHLVFRVADREIPAGSLARTLITRPESSVIVYSGDNFLVRETFFVPVNESGAVVHFDIETTVPLEIEASFVADFQLQWPAAIGGAYHFWDEPRHAFQFGEEQKKFFALFGSPTATNAQSSYQTNYSSSLQDSVRLGVTERGKDSKLLVLAASTESLAAADSTYKRLVATYDKLLKESQEYYRNYLQRGVSLTLPDAQLQQAYDWSRVSLIQGLVANPLLGTGLVAGYRTSGTSQRPGFAWFFGRDTFWSAFALDSSGDFETARAAIDFIAKFQRSDGKIPHEISQSASLVPWLDKYPYAYASADATPLYIIIVNDYVSASGDIDFARKHWASLWKAYQFMRSTYDANGFPQNYKIGHGWVEGGPLLPVKTEFYQAGLGTQSLTALAKIAKLAGKAEEAKVLEREYDRQIAVLNEKFWSPAKSAFAYALNSNDSQKDEVSVLTTVPMWFGTTDAEKSVSTLKLLAGPDHQTDWGTRIISSRSSLYDASGYHFGSVWPLFTGWASVAEYRYHQEFSGYTNLRANSLLALDGSLGHVTEVLSGDYYQPLSTASPEQTWSAAMVLSPMLRGMLGLSSDAIAHSVIFAPHVPADWRNFSVDNLKVGSTTLSFQYARAQDQITLTFNAPVRETVNCNFPQR